jgi:hypothetical protein
MYILVIEKRKEERGEQSAGQSSCELNVVDRILP